MSYLDIRLKNVYTRILEKREQLISTVIHRKCYVEYLCVSTHAHIQGTVRFKTHHYFIDIFSSGSVFVIYCLYPQCLVLLNKNEKHSRLAPIHRAPTGGSQLDTPIRQLISVFLKKLLQNFSAFRFLPKYAGTQHSQQITYFPVSVKIRICKSSIFSGSQVFHATLM